MTNETGNYQPEKDQCDTESDKKNQKDKTTTPLIYPQEGLINRTLPEIYSCYKAG